jgi:hypothetical protein
MARFIISNFGEQTLKEANAEYKQKLLKRIDKLKKGKIPWQALQFMGGCPECGLETNNKWIDDKILEIRNSILDEVEAVIKEV